MIENLREKKVGGGLGGASGEEKFAGLLLSRQQLSRR